MLWCCTIDVSVTGGLCMFWGHRVMWSPSRGAAVTLTTATSTTKCGPWTTAPSTRLPKLVRSLQSPSLQSSAVLIYIWIRQVVVELILFLVYEY